MGEVGELPNVLVVTKGHPFEAEPFFALFDQLDVTWTHAEQPDAQALLNRRDTEPFDALVMYDMPGISFTGADPPARFEPPSDQFVAAYLDMLEAGTGMVFLHHAIASWPAWPQFAEIVGGRFHYQPGTLGGTAWPDSGYVFDVEHTVEVLDTTHPICAGLEPTFTITDELYLFPVLEDDVIPLMRSGHQFTDDNFYSADRAIRGTRNSRDGWHHPPGSDLVAWVKHAANSPVAYLQFGDGPQTYADPNFRQILANAIGWAGSPDAHRWAQQRHRDTLLP